MLSIPMTFVNLLMLRLTKIDVLEIQLPIRLFEAYSTACCFTIKLDFPKIDLEPTKSYEHWTPYK